MSKAAVIDHVSAALGVSKLDASKAIDAVSTGVASVVGIGGTVRLNDLGTFNLKHKPARKGRHPGTGEAIDIAAKEVVVFKAAGRKG